MKYEVTSDLGQVYSKDLIYSFGTSLWFAGEDAAKRDKEYRMEPILFDNNILTSEYFVLYLLGYEYEKKQPEKFYVVLAYIAKKYAYVDKRNNIHKPHLDTKGVFGDLIDGIVKKHFYRQYSLYYFYNK